jgi:hypothetical protein
MEECPVYENTHENCGCEHCQQQALEKEFKDILNVFYGSERLRTLYNIPVSEEIRTACHHSEEALTSFLQKTMSEEASRRYVARISAKAEATKAKLPGPADKTLQERLEDAFEAALGDLHYMAYILYSPNIAHDDLNRPGIQLHYNASRDCEEKLLHYLCKTMSEEEAKAHIAAISDRVFAQHAKCYNRAE